jgi:ribosomal protein L37E
MALIKCPECGQEISDKATVCIKCGFPIEKHIKEEAEKTKKAEEEKSKYWCRRCCRQNAIGSAYCSFCGGSLTPAMEIDTPQNTGIVIAADGTRIDVEKAWNETGNEIACIKKIRLMYGTDLVTTENIVKNYIRKQNIGMSHNKPIKKGNEVSGALLIAFIFFVIIGIVCLIARVIPGVVMCGLFAFIAYPWRDPSKYANTKKPKDYRKKACPRCGSEKFRVFVTDKVISPEKVKYSGYGLHLFAPLTLFGQTREVKRMERRMQVSQFVCEECGKIFQ